MSPHRLAPDLTGLEPTDISALRRGLVSPEAFRGDRQLTPEARLAHGMVALTTTAAYLAVPHFVPADLALDVATTAPLDPESVTALRLPAPWTMILHEPVPLAAVEADDQELEAMIEEGRCGGSGPAVLGALLAARPDGTVDTGLGFVLMTSVDAQRGRLWYLQMAAFGDHGAGRLMHAYAAQLAFADWRPPPAAPKQERGKPGSAKSLKRLARDPAARAGALHGLRVLDYTAPSDEPQVPQPRTGHGAPLTERTFRRAYWKPGVRIGVRDEAGRLVGPVYKTGVEGQTFVRERRWIRRSRVRPDLPLREDRTVYRLPDAADLPRRE